MRLRNDWVRALCVCVLLLLGCGGGDDDGGAADSAAPPEPDAALIHITDAAIPADAAPRPDAVPPADAKPFVCPLEPTYGDLGSMTTGTAEVADNADGDDHRAVRVLRVVNEETPLGFLVDVWEGYGAIPGKFEEATFPMTVEIAGPEVNPQECGTCVYLATDADLFWAMSGTVSIDELNPAPDTGRIRGSVSGLTFKHMQESGEVIEDGCESRIDAFAFELGIVAAPDE